MTSVQRRTVAICFVLNMLDGLDIASISYAAPALSGAWGIEPVTLGIVFSAALAGMMAGSIFLAPFGDVIGRRNTIMLSLALIAAGMVGTLFATSVNELLALRFVTGLGLGGVVPTMATLAAEFSPLKRRNFAVTLVSAGYTLGSALTGLAALWFIPNLGWVSLFALGGALTIATLPLVYLALPESPDYLLSRQPRGALETLNGTLRAMRAPELASLPPRSATARPSWLGQPLLALGTLFSAQHRRATVLLWIAFFTSIALLYFLQNWVPQLAANAGLTGPRAVWAGTVLNFGAFVGYASVGFFGDRFGLRRAIATYLGVGAVVLLTFSYLQGTVAILTGLAVLGVTQGGFIGLYAVGARIYPASVRTTGLGWAIAVARPGAMLGPWVAGLLVAAGMGMAGSFMVFSITVVLAALAVIAIRSPELDPPKHAEDRQGTSLAAPTRQAPSASVEM